MDTKKLKAALATAQTELNALTDGEFKARRINSLRPLTLAAKALALVDTHIATAEKRAAGKDEPAGETAAAGAKASK